MKMLIAGLAAASTLLTAAPAAQAKDHGEGHGHGYGHERHGEYDESRGAYGGYAPQRHWGGYAPRSYYGGYAPRYNGYYGAHRPYGHAYGYYGQRRHRYGLRCFWRYGREVCVRR